MGRLQAEAWVLLYMVQQKLLYEMRPPAACLRACFPSPLGQAAQAWPACACLGNALDIKGALMEASTVEDDLLKLKRDLLSIDEQAAEP